MKRIEAIVKAIKGLTETTKRKVDRIIRSVENAKAYAQDKAETCREEADEIINKFGDYSDGSAESRDHLQDLLNEYADKMEEALTWDHYAAHYENLIKKLNETVEIEKE